jgi:hypothetical protein
MQGGQWQALYLVKRLEGATLLAPGESPLYAEAVKQNIDVQPLSRRLLRRLAEGSALVHAHDAGAHTMAALVSSAPLVVSRRVGFAVKQGLLSRWKYSQALLFLAVSEFVAAKLREARIPQARIRVVYDGVPIPQQSRREPGRVVALASKPVEIPGVPVDHTNNLWEALAAASVFVYKSSLEGLGSAALAAQAAGVPVVVSDAGGLPETVQDGVTGFIVKNDDFVMPVKSLLDDPALAEKMGRAARARVQAEFSVERMIERTKKAYEELLASC